MVEVFKIMNGHSSVNKETWFETVETNGPQTLNRSDPLNLKTKSFRSDVRKNFFSQRVVPLWNQLPNSVKSAPSITAFKSRYDANYHTWDVNRKSMPWPEHKITDTSWRHHHHPDTLIMALPGLSRVSSDKIRLYAAEYLPWSIYEAYSSLFYAAELPLSIYEAYSSPLYAAEYLWVLYQGSLRSVWSSECVL